MDVYPTMSILRGPFVPINEDIQLHQLFEANANIHPNNLAIIHEGIC